MPDTLLTKLNRRDCLKNLGAATLSALAAGFPEPVRAALDDETAERAKPEATADCMILLWMAGGMAHTETFDPKHYVPFSPGIESKRVLSTFPSIDSAVDQIKLTQGLENIARVMDQGALIRTYTVPVVDKIVHARYRSYWHTGYLPPLNVAAPHLGSVIARTLGPRHPDLPAFIDIGESLQEAKREALGIDSFLTAGFLGSEFGPFMVPEAAAAYEQMRARAGADRLRHRMKLFRGLVEESAMGEWGRSHPKESMVRAMEQGYRLMNSPAARAFDLSQEKKEVYERYNTGPFGLGCLLARRLAEAGARFLEVHTPYQPFGYWDTHENGHTTTARMKARIDRPIAQLIEDLRDRGLLDRTLVVLASEFSRDVLVEGKEEQRARVGRAAIGPVMNTLEHYGMHAHFAEAGSIVLFGGGIKKGAVYGRTSDEHPCKAVENPAGIEDVHATLYRALGISPKLAYEVERRPFYVTKDGLGRPIEDLF